METNIETRYQGYSEKSPYIDCRLPFEIEKQIERVNNNFPSAIIIDGISGSGKTTISIEALELAQRLRGEDEEIDYSKQYCMGGEDFQRKLPLCIESGKKLIIYDESGDYNRKQWQQKLNKNIDRIFDVYRTFRIIPILVLPVFTVLSSDLFLKGIPRILVHCGKRNKSYGNYSIYGARRMLILKAKMEDKRLIVKSDAYKIVRPNSYGHFKNLPLERSNRLEEICSQGKMSIMNKHINEFQGLITIEEMAEQLELSVDRTRKLVKEKRIEAKKRDGKRLLYDKNMLILLGNR